MSGSGIERRNSFRELVDTYDIWVFLVNRGSNVVFKAKFFDISFDGVGGFTDYSLVFGAGEIVEGMDLEIHFRKVIHFNGGAHILDYRLNEVNELFYNNITGVIKVGICWVDGNRFGVRIEGFSERLDRSRWERIVWKVHLLNRRKRIASEEIGYNEEFLSSQEREVEGAGEIRLMVCSLYYNGYCKLVNRPVSCGGGRERCKY